jgi:hypothetical protein
MYIRQRGLTVYNSDAENIYRQEPQNYESASTQYNQPYPQHPQHPQYPQYSSQSMYPTTPANSGYPAYQPPPLTTENNRFVPGEKIHPQAPRRKEGGVAHTTKAQALAIVRTCKKWLIIGSVVCFGVFGGLAATHITGVTSQAATNSATQQQTAPTDPSQGGGFFQQQPQQGGNNFGNNGNGNGNSQGPVSGSNVS